MKIKSHVSKLLVAILLIALINPFNYAKTVSAKEDDSLVSSVETISVNEFESLSGEENVDETSVVLQASDSEDCIEESVEDAAIAEAGLAGFNYDYAWDVLDIVNQERAANGLEPLVMDVGLMNTANLRAQEIASTFSHTRPDGSSCFTAWPKNKYYSAKGENIAAGQRTPEWVMDAWMKSQGHRENILSEYYNCIGISCYYDPNSEYGYNWSQNFGYTSNPNVITKNGKFEATGIKVEEASKNRFVGFAQVTNPTGEDLEYSWYISGDNGSTWSCISEWNPAEGISFVPNKFGEYTIVVKARKKNSPNEIVSAGTTYSYHPYIYGKCQMPYTGQGGGWLIGVESYENPNQSYQYEMLILDCNLYVQGKPAWIYTTGKCGVASGKALWVVWQPVYGYYWTLFRVYDKNGNLIDEICYGFENI